MKQPRTYSLWAASTQPGKRLRCLRRWRKKPSARLVVRRRCRTVWPVKRWIGMAAAWEVERLGAPGDFQDLS